jgi:hypothetical protein
MLDKRIKRKDQVIDFSPILDGALYGPLQDVSIFNGCRPETDTALVRG